MKALGIMQPYFLPYIGYFQLIKMVDEYVLYDNIEFTKKGWIHRNRMLQNGVAEYFTLPLKKDSDFLDIMQRYLVDDFVKEKDKILRKIDANYRKAPCFEDFYPIVKSIFDYESKNLFEFIFNSIMAINRYLDINTPIIVSSTLPSYIKELKSQEKVLAICKETNSKVYVNSSGGMELYESRTFENKQVTLKFYKSKNIQYTQYRNEFVSYLSILDVCMFNSKHDVVNFLNEYELVEN